MSNKPDFPNKVFLHPCKDEASLGFFFFTSFASFRSKHRGGLTSILMFRAYRRSRSERRSRLSAEQRVITPTCFVKHARENSFLLVLEYVVTLERGVRNCEVFAVVNSMATTKFETGRASSGGLGSMMRVQSLRLRVDPRRAPGCRTSLVGHGCRSARRQQRKLKVSMDAVTGFFYPTKRGDHRPVRTRRCS